MIEVASGLAIVGCAKRYMIKIAVSVEVRQVARGRVRMVTAIRNIAVQPALAYPGGDNDVDGGRARRHPTLAFPEDYQFLIFNEVCYYDELMVRLVPPAESLGSSLRSRFIMAVNTWARRFDLVSIIVGELKVPSPERARRAILMSMQDHSPTPAKPLADSAPA
tara:strand:+ start:11760 stop:12251 length:492 start_codon:yes stop_codon:yes gene_type:complete